MSILVGIPVLYHGNICHKAFMSVIDEADLLIIDNGSDQSVKYAISLVKNLYNDGVVVIENEVNQYVNQAWNQIMEYFLNSDYDHLVIMNSDLIMQPGWSKHLIDGVSCIPTDGSHKEDVCVTEGIQGVFIHLNKEMARLVYPIPEKIKIWFGDNWIFGKLIKAGFKVMIRSGMIAEHYQNGSKTVLKVPGVSEIIEQDKLAWAEIDKNI